MMHSLPTLILLAVLEHWEVNYPQEAQLIWIYQATTTAHLQTKLTQSLSYNQWLIGNNQQQVASLSTGSLLDILESLIRVELLEWRFNAFLSVLNPSQALGAIALYILNQAIKLTTRNISIALYIDNLYLTAILQNRLEYLEILAGISLSRAFWKISPIIPSIMVRIVS